jgi:hypothetical protein
MPGRRAATATLRRPPAPGWDAGMRQAFAALYATEPLPADEAARLERECAQVPYRSARQGDLALPLPERSTA